MTKIDKMWAEFSLYVARCKQFDARVYRTWAKLLAIVILIVVVFALGCAALHRIVGEMFHGTQSVS